MSLLTCKNVTFSYEGTSVLENINFSINDGDYLCIVGENGAGKSTLMKGILNLKKCSKGQIILGDGLKTNEIGYLPQQTQIQRDFPASVSEVVLSGRLNKLGKRLWYNSKDREEAIKCMKLLNILELKDACYRDLSGGQQQRVLLARALCSSGRIVILDEPVTGLDPIVSKEMYQLINSLNKEQKLTIIMVSHDVKETIEYATHILHLGGEQLFFGTKKEYLSTSLGKQFVGGEYT